MLLSSEILNTFAHVQCHICNIPQGLFQTHLNVCAVFPWSPQYELPVAVLCTQISPISSVLHSTGGPLIFTTTMRAVYSHNSVVIVQYVFRMYKKIIFIT